VTWPVTLKVYGEANCPGIRVRVEEKFGLPDYVRLSMDQVSGPGLDFSREEAKALYDALGRYLGMRERVLYEDGESGIVMCPECGMGASQDREGRVGCGTMLRDCFKHCEECAFK